MLFHYFNQLFYKKYRFDFFKILHILLCLKKEIKVYLRKQFEFYLVSKNIKRFTLLGKIKEQLKNVFYVNFIQINTIFLISK